jgi:hypothetical protein
MNSLIINNVFFIDIVLNSSKRKPEPEHASLSSGFVMGIREEWRGEFWDSKSRRIDERFASVMGECVI